MKKRKIDGRLIERLRTDYEFRTFAASILSFCFTLGFACYNTFLGAVYKAGWNIGIAVYYFLLLAFKVFIYVTEYRFYKAGFAQEQKEERRKRLAIVQSVLLVVIDLALIAPITLMIGQKREINYSEIPAIATAAYTVYKIIAAGIHSSKTSKSENSSVKILRRLHFKDALVSVLSLQYVLTMTFGEGANGSMARLCMITSGAIWLFLLALSIGSFVRAIKLRR